MGGYTLKILDTLQTAKIGPCLWELTAPFKVQNGITTFEVPFGFITDGASTPRFLWGLCPPMSGRTAEAAVLHDWLYSLTYPERITRAQADFIFLLTMECNGVGAIRRRTVYSGVRAGGAGSFQKLHYWEKATDKTLY